MPYDSSIEWPYHVLEKHNVVSPAGLISEMRPTETASQFPEPRSGSACRRTTID